MNVDINILSLSFIIQILISIFENFDSKSGVWETVWPLHMFNDNVKFPSTTNTAQYKLLDKCTKQKHCNTYFAINTSNISMFNEHNKIISQF